MKRWTRWALSLPTASVKLTCQSRAVQNTRSRWAALIFFMSPSSLLLASTAKAVFEATKFVLLDKRPFLNVVCICILKMPAERTIVVTALEKQIAHIGRSSSLLRRTRKHMRRTSTLVYGACSPSKGLFWLHVCKTSGQRKTLRFFSFPTTAYGDLLCGQRRSESQ